VASFNELSNQLLREYSTDDTRRIKEVTDKHNGAWNSINNRWDTHTHVATNTHMHTPAHTHTHTHVDAYTHVGYTNTPLCTQDGNTR